MDLTGARALVTGGSEGIGRAIAAALVRNGCTVGITGRRADVLAAAAEEIGASAWPGDVSNEDDVVGTVEGFCAASGGLDILVNNAGFGRFAPLVEMDKASFESVLATNVTGAMLMGREAAKRFIAQGGGGHIVNVSSTSGLSGGKRGTAYATSKFALRGMTECWRAELRPHDVRVILVNPSEVQTGFAAAAGYTQEPSPKKLVPEDIADAIVGVLQLEQRALVPEFSVWANNPF